MFIVSAKTCTQIKYRNAKATSGSYNIDPDGPGGHGPFMVFCDMNDKMAVGVTVVGHDSESRTSVKGFEDPGSYERNVSYLGGDFDAVAKLSGLVDASKNCEQFIKYECNGSSGLTHMAGGCHVTLRRRHTGAEPSQQIPSSAHAE